MNINVHCQCSWAGHECSSGSADQPQPPELSAKLTSPEPSESRQALDKNGSRRFQVGATLSLKGPVVRVGKVWYLCPRVGTFEPATLRLYANGFTIVKKGKDKASKPTEKSVAWSPFTNVQACRLHSEKADEAFPWLRLFKVSIFHFSDVHYFAARNANQPARPSIQSEAAAALVVGEGLSIDDCGLERYDTLTGDADLERMRWIVDMSRTLRAFTCSLFPAFQLAVEPVIDRASTHRRLLAGYVLLCLQDEVDVVYLELSAYSDGVVPLTIYADESCSSQVTRISMTLETEVTERAGVDCSCFSVGGYNLVASTVAEKRLWLRVISNVKVKIRHHAKNPSSLDISVYRASILEFARSMKKGESKLATGGEPLLPRCLVHDKPGISESSNLREARTVTRRNPHNGLALQDSLQKELEHSWDDDVNMPEVAEEDEESIQHELGLPLEAFVRSFERKNGMIDPSSRWLSLGDSMTSTDRECSLLSCSDLSQLGEPFAEPEPSKLPLAALPSHSHSSSRKSPSMLAPLFHIIE